MHRQQTASTSIQLLLKRVGKLFFQQKKPPEKKEVGGRKFDSVAYTLSAGGGSGEVSNGGVDQAEDFFNQFNDRVAHRRKEQLDQDQGQHQKKDVFHGFHSCDKA